jgi:hypothetical protein
MTKRLSEDRASSCAFTSSDGRQCRMPRSSRDDKYCLHHERTMRRLLEADFTAANIADPLSRNFISGTSLNQSLARLFSAIADGRIPPKTAAQLISLSKLLLKSIPMAKTEFSLAFNNSKAVHRMIRQMYGNTEQPATLTEADDRSSEPPPPLPDDPREFVQQVLSSL